MNSSLIVFRRLVNSAMLLALIVIGLGVYTRLTDAGLGCPDWPGCYGKLTAPLHEEHIAKIQQKFPNAVVEPHKAHNEMLHRYIAGLLGLLVLSIFLLSLVIKRWRKFGVLLLALIIMQALLGMWTVTLNLIPLVVMAHLLGGFFLLGLLALLRLDIFNAQYSLAVEPELRRFLPLAYIAATFLLMQIALGGWTSANYAALVCTQLPVCDVGWQTRFSLESIFHLPLGHETYEYGVLSYDARMSIHVAHRIGAMVTTLIVALLLVCCWRNAKTAGIRRLVLMIGLLLVTQISLGIANIYWQLPLANAVAHNLVAANLLMLTLVFIRQLHLRTRTGALTENSITKVAMGASQSVVNQSVTNQTVVNQ